jgi:glycosyltransferase involved in cell wall biosynthesis
MRILFATTHKHLPELRGGMEINTHELARAFIAANHTVGVLCGLAGFGTVGYVARAKMKLLRQSAPCDRALGYPVWRTWDPVPAVAAVAAAFKPEVVIVQGGADFNALVRACLPLNVPLVCYLHTEDRLPLPDDLRASRALHFVVNSAFTKSIHPEKTIDAIFRPLMARADYAVESNRSSALFVNPAPHKGLGVVMALAASRPDVPFLFVANRHTLERQVIDLSHHPNVRMIGPFADMRQAYRRAKLVLAPSQWIETWGRVVSEAQFSGIPALASGNGGLPEAVGPGGICVNAAAPAEDWLAAFSALWDDDARYRKLSGAALDYAGRAEIDPDTTVRSFLAYLSALVR